jgi:hypothetical protein
MVEFVYSDPSGTWRTAVLSAEKLIGGRFGLGSWLARAVVSPAASAEAKRA